MKGSTTLARLLATSAFAMSVGLDVEAKAHHVPGHSASEGVRNLNSLGGGSGQATSRVLVLQEFSRTSSVFAPGSTYATSIVGEYAVHPWVSVGLQPTVLVIDEDRARRQAGLGDARATLRLTPHADKLIHRVLTVGLSASFPTKTVQLDVDTGRTWIVSPNVLFTRTYDRPFWQLMALATFEERPAGSALDVSAGGQLGYRFKGRFAPALGTLVDLRVLNACVRPDGSRSLCTDSRAGEKDRDVGSLRAHGLVSFSYSASNWAILSASVQYPMTARRDFEVAGSASVQFILGGRRRHRHEDGTRHRH